MFTIYNLSIRKKLVLMQLFTSLLVLAVAVITIAVVSIREFREKKVENAHTLASLISMNSISALDFRDEAAAKEILFELSKQPDILNAVIFDITGDIFATYNKTDSLFRFFIPVPYRSYHVFTKDFLIHYTSIYKNGEAKGLLAIRFELSKLKQIKRNIIGLAVLLVFIGTVFAILIAAVSQKYISRPILELVGLFEKIQKEKNYSLRAEVVGNDEISALTAGLNTMLETINKRDHELEEKVRERTAQLQELNENLTINEERFRKIVEGAGVMVFSSDQEEKIKYCNPACEYLTGYKPAELSGKKFSELIVPEWRQKVADYFNKQFRSGEKIASFSFQILTKSGEKKWVEQSQNPNFDNGKITGYKSLVRDLTEEKKMVKLHHEAYQDLLDVLNFVPIGISITEYENDRFTYVNDLLCELTGYQRTEMIGKTAQELRLVSSEYWQKLVQQIQDLDGKTLNREIQFRKAGGEITDIMYSAKIVDFDDKKSILSTFFDLKTRKELEKKITDAEKKAVEIDEKMKLIIENIGEGIIVLDTEENVLLQNSMAVEIIGYGEKKETVPADWSDKYELYYSDEKTIFPKQELPLNKALNGEKTAFIEIVLLDPESKEKKNILATGHPVRNKENEIIAAVATIKDITEYQKLRNETSESEKKYRDPIGFKREENNV